MVRSGHAVTVVGDRVAAAKAARVIGGGHVIVVKGDHAAAARTARTIGDSRGVAVVSERAAAAAAAAVRVAAGDHATPTRQGPTAPGARRERTGDDLRSAERADRRADGRGPERAMDRGAARRIWGGSGVERANLDIGPDVAAAMSPRVGAAAAAGDPRGRGTGSRRLSRAWQPSQRS